MPSLYLRPIKARLVNEATKRPQKTLLKADSLKPYSALAQSHLTIFLTCFKDSHSSTNDVNTANVHVSTGSTPVSTASTNNSTACLSDATIYAYLATQPNGSQVVHQWK
ncbi:hypothetical protein Tco_1458977 [Tanacetum coccineum]